MASPIVPARAARPRDKAKVEVGVQVVERWILARLRHHTFFSLLELNTAIAALLVRPQPAALQETARLPPERVRVARPSRPPAPARPAL